MTAIEIDAKTTALVAVDLQYGIVALTAVPTPSAVVVARTRRIADALRSVGGTIVWVRVANTADGRDTLAPATDAPARPAPPRPADFADLVAELGRADSDLVITKRQWGAFHGTELDLQLRRRGIRTLIVTGIATNVGVESTARDAFEHGYEQIFVDDAISALNAEAHAATLKFTLPRIGRIRSSDAVVAAL